MLAVRIDFGRSDRIPLTRKVGDGHVDVVQVDRRVVPDRADEAGVPGPIVIGKSSQDSDESLCVCDVEPERTHSLWGKTMFGRPGQCVTQPIEDWPKVAQQM